MSQVLRIIDANCNRIGEGLRFLEDVTRFSLNDATLSRQLKVMRHGIIKNISKLGISLISHRNAASDVGAKTDIRNEQNDLSSLITANAKRVEQGLRTIEELSKLPEMSLLLDSHEFQKARFDLYTIEQKLLSRILRQQKASRLTGVYAILDTDILQGRDELQAATQAIKGGAKIIQLRDKQYVKRKLLTTAQNLRDLCRKSDVLFIINDHLDIARIVGADGLHIGQEDMPFATARREMPIDKIIGCSITSPEQAFALEKEGADYIAIGAIYATSTKKNIDTVGLEKLSQIKKKVSIPVVAIGGINGKNINEVLSAGADAAAIISAIFQQDDIEKATRQLVSKISIKKTVHRKKRYKSLKS